MIWIESRRACAKPQATLRTPRRWESDLQILTQGAKSGFAEPLTHFACGFAQEIAIRLSSRTSSVFQRQLHRLPALRRLPGRIQNLRRDHVGLQRRLIIPFLNLPIDDR